MIKGLGVFGSKEDTQGLTVYERWKKANAMTIPPWREAASVIITIRARLDEMLDRNLGNTINSVRWGPKNPDSCDYRIMMVKRSRATSYMANAFVFPGGLIEEADFDPRWWEVFQSMGIEQEDIEDFCAGTVKGPRPPMITDPITLAYGQMKQRDRCIPPNLAFRIAAIRETFEETGVPLLKKALNYDDELNGSNGDHQENGDTDNTYEMALWRQKIRQDPHYFLDMCLDLKMYPDYESMVEWWDWLTPVSVGHRRYDTMFYFCCLDKQPRVVLDQSEVTTLKWTAPSEMLAEYSQGEVFLAPPQVYELSRLLQIDNFSSLKKFSQQRQREGVEQWLPVIASAKDGAISVLPGDDLYPKKPDYYGKMPCAEFSQTLDELRNKAQNTHRLEIRGATCTIYTNLTPTCGHLQPVTYQGTVPMAQSML